MLGAKEAQSVLGNDPPHHHTPTTSFTCWYQAGRSCAFIYVYTKFWPHPTLLFSFLHTLNSRTHHSLYPYIVLLSTLVLLSAVHFIHKTEDGVLSFYKCTVFSDVCMSTATNVTVCDMYEPLSDAEQEETAGICNPVKTDHSEGVTDSSRGADRSVSVGSTATTGNSTHWFTVLHSNRAQGSSSFRSFNSFILFTVQKLFSCICLQSVPVVHWKKWKWKL